mmetsp:Transcript_22127/g.71638  ORF Transcript_22127/g.71638 Transcript_22127/m.71638 type:complete len:267 (-) Transcript_22127:1371-2171(-)
MPSCSTRSCRFGTIRCCHAARSGSSCRFSPRSRTLCKALEPSPRCQRRGLSDRVQCNVLSIQPSSRTSQPWASRSGKRKKLCVLQGPILWRLRSSGCSRILRWRRSLTLRRKLQMVLATAQRPKNPLQQLQGQDLPGMVVLQEVMVMALPLALARALAMALAMKMSSHVRSPCRWAKMTPWLPSKLLPLRKWIRRNRLLRRWIASCQMRVRSFNEASHSWKGAVVLFLPWQTSSYVSRVRISRERLVWTRSKSSRVILTRSKLDSS